jgi:hypothetical protein
MFSFLHEIPIQAFYTSAFSLSCEITLFLITEQNKVDTRFLLESAREREQCPSSLILSLGSLSEIAFCDDSAVVSVPTASRTVYLPSNGWPFVPGLWIGLNTVLLGGQLSIS